MKPAMSLLSLPRRLFLKDDRVGWREHVSNVWKFHQWERGLRAQYPTVKKVYGNVTAILLNYARPQNMNLAAHLMLNTPAIGDVVVSNNNPDCDISKWLWAPTGKLRIMSQPQKSSSFMRFVVAKEERRSSLFLSVDDDIFLHPAQVQLLCERLMADPSVPHGIYGQKWTGDAFRGGIALEECRVDVLSRVYAYTTEHVSEFFRLIKEAGLSVDELASLECTDDIFLSFSGDKRPLIHNVGPFIDCPTQGKKGIAAWRRDNFHAHREEIYKKLCAIKPLPPDA